MDNGGSNRRVSRAIHSSLYLERNPDSQAGKGRAEAQEDRGAGEEIRHNDFRRQFEDALKRLEDNND